MVNITSIMPTKNNTKCILPPRALMLLYELHHLFVQKEKPAICRLVYY